MTVSNETRSVRFMSRLKSREVLATVGIAGPALVWAFLNFGMTLAFGHPTTDTRELPYIEVALQGLVALGVMAFLPNQSRVWWLVALAPIPVWALSRALTSDTSPVWAVLLSVLLLSPILSVLLACEATERVVPVLRVAFLAIMIGQLLTFPFNLVGLLADDSAIPLDRFSGTLLGRGGYFSSYILLAGAFFLALTRARYWVKALSFAVVLGYAWMAEVKLIFFVTGVVLATLLVFSCTRRSAAWKVPGAAVAVVMGTWLSLSVPSSYGLQVDNYGFAMGSAEQSITQLGKLIEPTTDSLTSTTPATQSATETIVESNGSKLAATIAVLSPTSDLWAQSERNPLWGVGPTGGLSHLARVADASGFLAGASRPDPDFREQARSLAGSRQRDQSLATQPESTVNGLVSDLGYVGLLLFLLSSVVAVILSLRVFTRTAVGVFVGFAVAFVPFFSLWETPGLWMVIALGMATVGVKPGLSSKPRSATT